jgi:WD40 repeat protein
VMIWDVNGYGKHSHILESQTTPVYDLAFSPNGSELVYATEGGLVYLELKEISLP